MAKKIISDSACPSCRSKGRDSKGNHLLHMENTETGERWYYCNHCSHYELVERGVNEERWSSGTAKREWTPEEIAAAVSEVNELPIKELKSRAISHSVADRFGVRAGLSQQDGETVVSHFYPKTTDGVVTGYKVRNLEHKMFHSVGKASGCDLFGIEQARRGDVYTKKLFIFEDELSAMSGFECLTKHANTTIKPAVVALPDGSGSAASALARNRKFVEGFEEIVVCMDNDAAGEEAFRKIRDLYPERVKKAIIPKGVRKDGKPIKDANDLHMEGRSLELFNNLKYTASREIPSGAVSVYDCLEDALKKPEWGYDYPWPGLTELTFGLRYGDMIAVGGGTGSGCNVSHSWAGMPL